MTVPSQSGLWSFAPQAGKVGRGNTFDPAIYKWYQFLTPRTNIGPVQIQRRIVPEMGSVITPRGQHKQLRFYGGDVAFLPRLENIVGWIFLMTMGAVTTETDVNSDGEAAVGLNTHRFHYASNQYYLPWFASRFKTAGEDSADDSGELGFDCKVRSLRITVPQMGQAAMQMTVQGRDFKFDNAPGAWAYENAVFEGEDTIPLSGSGYLKLGGIEYPITGLVIDINNYLTDPRQEAIIGDTAPDDVKPMSRDITIRFAYKYENADLCRLIYAGETDGTEWNPLPYSLETAGGVPAFDLALETPGDVVGLPGVPHRLRIIANKVTISRDAPPTMQAGDIIVEQYTLEFETPDTGHYAELIIENGVDAYAWPAVGSQAAPVLTITPSAVEYTGVALAIAPAGAITDADSPNFDTGVINALLAGANYDDTNDALVVASTGGVTNTAGALTYAGVSGTVANVAGDGKTASPLVITFTDKATPAVAQAILRAIQYNRTGGGTNGHIVTASVYVTDGDGKQSQTRVVTLTHNI